MKLLWIIFSWTLCASVCRGYRILGIFPFHAKSHFMMFERIMKGLVKNGHQVDVISTFPQKKPYENYTDLITFDSPRHFVNNFSYDEMIHLVGSMPVMAVANMGGNDVCLHLGNLDLQKLVKNPPNDPPYDAVIIEIFGAHCFAIVGHLLKVPVIGASSSVLYPWANDIIANPENLAILPNNLVSLPMNMKFSERLYNVVFTYLNKFYFNYATSVQDQIIRKHFGQDMPGVRELESRISMILANSHLSINGIRPVTHALIEVGGLHVQDEDVEIPASLEKWMNESTNGFVYFTFGSMIQIETFPPKYLSIFYNSLGKIAPVRVLMKVPKPSKLPPGLPKNILTLPWMPQMKVLQHRNIKAFITHGGLMGTQEAIACGVPLIGIPLFADQFINVDIYARLNFAIQLDIPTLTEEKMDEALKSILTNPIYRETAQKISKRFLDRPMSAVDTSNYWIEYIIRHGADVLRSPAMDLSWWQLALLDVYAFCLFVALIAIFILIILIKFVYNIVSSIISNYRATLAKKIT